MGSIKILIFKGPTLWRGHSICSLELQQGIGWICDHHLPPAPTALRSLGLSKGGNLLAHKHESSIPWEQRTPMTAALCDPTAAAITAGGSFAIRKKQSGSEAALPKRQPPLPLCFGNSLLPGKGRIQGLLSLLLEASVLSSSAPVRWSAQRQCPECQSAVIQASPLLYAPGIHWESTKRSRSPTTCCKNHKGQKKRSKSCLRNGVLSMAVTWKASNPWAGCQWQGLNWR